MFSPDFLFPRFLAVGSENVLDFKKYILEVSKIKLVDCSLM